MRTWAMSFVEWKDWNMMAMIRIGLDCGIAVPRVSPGSDKIPKRSINGATVASSVFHDFNPDFMMSIVISNVWA